MWGRKICIFCSKFIQETVSFIRIAPSFVGDIAKNILVSFSGNCNKTHTQRLLACSHIRLLGVYISSDLSLDHHVPRICVGCCYRLSQLRRLGPSLDSDSLATLVYVVVNSRIDYCNTVLAGAPLRTVTDKLQRCWTHLRASSPALGSLTTTWVRYCTTNFTGSKSLTRCSSSWQC